MVIVVVGWAVVVVVVVVVGTATLWTNVNKVDKKKVKNVSCMFKLTSPRKRHLCKKVSFSIIPIPCGHG